MKAVVEEVKIGSGNSYYLKTYKRLQKDFINNRNEKFYDYLMGERNLTKKMIEKFELGYNNTFFDIKKKDPLIAKDSITIPFRDVFGRIVAFQSRFINKVKIKNQNFKYFFSHNLPFVYQRSKYIYNLNRVLTKYYKKAVIIVEGVFDLISLYQVGIYNVISPLQNRLTMEQTEILRRYFDKIYFLMDKGETGEVILNNKNVRLFDLRLYKIPVKDVNSIELKDANDMLRANIDIKKFMKENKQQVEV